MFGTTHKNDICYSKNITVEKDISEHFLASLEYENIKSQTRITMDKPFLFVPCNSFFSNANDPYACNIFFHCREAVFNSGKNDHSPV